MATVDFTLDRAAIEAEPIRVTVLRPDMAPTSELEEQQVREANPRDSGELLRELPGVEAVRRGPLGLGPGRARAA